MKVYECFGYNNEETVSWVLCKAHEVSGYQDDFRVQPGFVEINIAGSKYFYTGRHAEERAIYTFSKNAHGEWEGSWYNITPAKHPWVKEFVKETSEWCKRSKHPDYNEPEQIPYL